MTKEELKKYAEELQKKVDNAKDFNERMKYWKVLCQVKRAIAANQAAIDKKGLDEQPETWYNKYRTRGKGGQGYDV